MIYKIDIEVILILEYIIKWLLLFKESNEGRKQIGKYDVNVIFLVKLMIKNNINRMRNV